MNAIGWPGIIFPLSVHFATKADTQKSNQRLTVSSVLTKFSSACGFETQHEEEIPTQIFVISFVRMYTEVFSLS
jgi:hypothetical protein